MLMPDSEKVAVEDVVEGLLTRKQQKRIRDAEPVPDWARRRAIANVRGPSVMIIDACRSVQRTGYREIK